MEAKDLNQIARQLFAMEQKRRKPNVGETMQNERYHRTMSDEYPWLKKPRASAPITEEQKEMWRKLAEAKP